ncbi:16S rRNA (guanine(966)-N(2))-methyltransferase RsmD [Thermosyntropha lipolytica DSM 11003]|uniref:16S rRNA (Guanine(966)-N(2))-methyltransferase RsmD n=1 Tax=Thermosyntropha lipolytica DSM 11003 TaxID=1123382 RepID=A0A1M5P5M6_9FIRM|nr:16S rRNA (guanine(966)-N(2))-methyltransferase RsmD [Thermosyntropha lipolytica]SHG97131.1 16S rRNA (guanine(966)-N(2))-methyltransferase RsmD [Thermosyntropha lipolytica DSM 11003]
MRVIAGRAKNKRLIAPPGLNTRPLTDMIKEALFNVLGEKVIGAAFLDLFCGSGNAGIEALSRGADQVIFIDSSREAIKAVKDNIMNCGFTEGFEVYCNDVFRALKILKKRKLKFDIIFADPPFTNPGIFVRVMQALDKADLLKEDGILIIRSKRDKEMPEKLTCLVRYRMNSYGDSTLHYYKMLREDLR